MAQHGFKEYKSSYKERLVLLMVNVLFYESSDLFCFISEGFLRAYYVPRALGMQRDGFCEAFGQWVGQGFRQACCGWGRGRGVRYM